MCFQNGGSWCAFLLCELVIGRRSVGMYVMHHTQPSVMHHAFLSVLFTAGPPAPRTVPGTKQGLKKNKWTDGSLCLKHCGWGLACTSVAHRQAPLPGGPVDTQI